MSSIDESKQFVPLNIAVLTISDSRSLEDDKSGTTLSERLTAAGHKLAAREIVTDDVEAIRGIIRRWIADASVDAVITTGGTGFTGRDVTPEAIEPLFEKRIDGFGEEFRRRSWGATSSYRSSEHEISVGARAMLSRATAGVVSATIVIAIPGSPAAVEVAAPLLVDMLPHGVEIATGRHGQHAHKK